VINKFLACMMIVLLLVVFSVAANAKMVVCDSWVQRINHEPGEISDYRGRAAYRPALQFDTEAGTIEFLDSGGDLEPFVEGKIENQGDLLSIYAPAVTGSESSPESIQLSYYRQSRVYTLVERLLDYEEVAKTEWRDDYADPDLWIYRSRGQGLFLDWGLCRE